MDEHAETVEMSLQLMMKYIWKISLWPNISTRKIGSNDENVSNRWSVFEQKIICLDQSDCIILFLINNKEVNKRQPHDNKTSQYNL